jgi:molybdenum cofactor cytidylyltransferase
MRENKLALPWKNETILTHLVGQLAPLVDRTLVLLGPRSESLRSEIHAPAEIHATPGQTPDMRSTIEFGLTHLEQEDPNETGILIALADQPQIRRPLVEQMILLFQNQPTRLIVPTVDGKTAHPILIPLAILRELPRLESRLGLNSLVRSHAPATNFLPIDDPWMLLDIDEPADYDRLRRKNED